MLRVVKFYIPGEQLGHDESQILSSSKVSRVAYRGAKTKKPMKDYINVFAIHESSTGYCYIFKIDERPGGPDVIKKALIEMFDQLPKRPYKIAVDRYYSQNTRPWHYTMLADKPI